jgi:hypothetical protein
MRGEAKADEAREAAEKRRERVGRSMVGGK